MPIQPIDVDGLVFDVRVDDPPDDGANGPPVLLLHGFPQDSSSFAEVSRRLHASGLRTIAPDQRGYSPGARPAGVEQYGVLALVADALGLLDALGVASAYVVGHDWGAAVAWQLAARHPERVAGLVAASVGHPVAFSDALRTDADQQQRSAYMQEFGMVGTAEDSLLADGCAGLRAFTGTATATVAEAVTERPGLTAALNWYRAMATPDYRDCPDVEVPTTFLWGTADHALGRTQAVGTARHVRSDYRFVELPGVSHWIPEEAAAALSTEVALRSGSW